jgi:glycosyl-4,4'-diaponeurosporenoate acyltransferase
VYLLITEFAPHLHGRLLTALIIGAVCGVISFVTGQMLPRGRFDYDAFPYRAFKWEKGGAIYEKIRVRAWKDRLPDMSRIIPKMVKKKASLARDERAMERLVQETCVAEFVHWLLIIIASPIIGVKVGGLLGAIVAVLYALGNMLFVIIQRYNRPRLREILRRMEERQKRCY